MQIAPASPQKLNQRDTRLSPVWIQLRQYAAGYSATQRAGQRHLRSFIGLRSVHSVVSAEPCSLGNKSTAWVLTWNMKLQGDNYGASNVQESDPMLWCGGRGCIAFVPSSSTGLDAHARTKRAAPLTAHHFSDCGKQRPDILGCNRPEWFLTWVQCLKWSDAQVNEKAYFPWASLWFSPDLHIDRWGKVLTSTKVNFLDDGLRSAKISSSDGTGNFMFF